MDGLSSRLWPVIDSLPVCTDIAIHDGPQLRPEPLLQFHREP
jgi:hypothetical protein